MRSGTSRGNAGGMVITHREYIRDITPSNAFTKWEFPINPGLGITFPWLSQLAESYEEYKIKALIFEFRSLASDTMISTAGTSSGMGSVIMGTNYNPNQNPFVDKRTMENYEGTLGRKPSQSFVHVVNVKKSSTPAGVNRWVRTAAPLTNEDKRLYDIGTFSLATIGQDTAASGVIGELWVAYQIEFFKPKYSGSIGSNLLYDHYSLTAANSGTSQPGSIFGTLTLSGTRANMNPGCGTTLTGNPGLVNKITFKAEHQGMTFLIFVGTKGGSTVNNQQILYTTLTNVTAPNTWFTNQTAANFRTAANDSGDLVMYMNYFYVATSPSGPWTIEFDYSGGSNLPTSANMDVIVVQVDGQAQPVPV